MAHSLGPTCTYYSEPPGSSLNAQFFYISSVPIDDPLSPIPSSSEKPAADPPPQPFSPRDNAALEEAWQAFRMGKEPQTEVTRGSRPLLGKSRRTETVVQPSKPEPVIVTQTARLQLGKPGTSETAVQFSEQEPVTAEEIRQEDATESIYQKRRFSPFRRRQKKDKGEREVSPDTVSATTDTPPEHKQVAQPSTAHDSNISGRPFARAPSERDIKELFDGPAESDSSDQPTSPTRSRLHNAIHPHHKQEKKVYVPVGVSRLHLVEFPTLIMKPIYWSPINDQSSVVRATWFFQDTMHPVPAEIANRLELGYEDLKPYSDTYQDELNACVENGAAAELKIVWKLWPEDKKPSRPGTAQNDSMQEGHALSFGDGQAEMVKPESGVNTAADARNLHNEKLYGTWSVIYVDDKEAQMLKPSLLPSESRNRRPLQSIRKGREIGIAVVRGFDRKAWLKLHPDPKIDTKAAHASIGAYLSQSGDATTKGRRMSCEACEKERKAPFVSDLVLVIHGIGQKLSERVDSFHFTHAINGLRREFNVELASEAVKGNLSRDMGGVMVLPVNWRLTVSFDDQPGNRPSSTKTAYQMADITPDSLPAVRSMISDVMLDIPYYMSHHKEKMTFAVIKEANRVYRLWCRNNPGFQEYGRVHLVAHSLGSVMALDILSKQPTQLSKTLDLTSPKSSSKTFDFNTTNLFCCGSPVGFFLLLNGANLVPRKARNKTGMELADRGPGVAREASYGCLAVDNIYNILHRNDPVSYQLNACVDKDYASSLVPAVIPSAGIGFFARVGTALHLGSSSAAVGYGSLKTPQRPAMQSLPSTVELETHDFTQEEIAEKRMYLLNDNGQIDFILNPAGGPLDWQYLDMLGAHSSYWVLPDFARFLVVEIGRAPGKDGTLPVLRARKGKEYKKGSIA